MSTSSARRPGRLRRRAIHLRRAHDQEFHASITANTYVTLGTSTSGWLASCRKSNGADNHDDMDQRFEQ